MRTVVAAGAPDSGIQVLIHDDLLGAFKDFLRGRDERLDGPYTRPGGGTYYVIRQGSRGPGPNSAGVNGFGSNTVSDPGDVVR